MVSPPLNRPRVALRQSERIERRMPRELELSRRLA